MEEKHMKKRILSAILAIIMVVGLIPTSVIPQAQANISGDWQFEVNDDGTVTLIHYTGNDLIVNIPERLTTFGDIISTRTVSGIEPRWEISGNWEVFNSNIVSVTIPDSVTHIGARAFAHMNSLTSVTIGRGVETIGGGAFFNCTSLTTVTIPGNVKNIHDSAFSGCSGLVSVVFEEGVVRLGSNIFGQSQWSGDRTPNLRAVIVPESVQFMESTAFDGAPNATIFGTADSYAHNFAVLNEISFTPINSTYRFSVNYSLNGGIGMTPQSVQTHPGFTIQRPSAPTRDGFVFTGWFRDAAGTVPWEFASNLVMNDMTLYAGWGIPCNHCGEIEINCTCTVITCNRCNETESNCVCTQLSPCTGCGTLIRTNFCGNCGTPAHGVTAPSFILGDIDGDGHITVMDALEILKYLAGIPSLLDPHL
jgi:uncharacterized repeat protein (TIGR02543 family)